MELIWDIFIGNLIQRQARIILPVGNIVNLIQDGKT
jgi:hypothetical protein